MDDQIPPSEPDCPNRGTRCVVIHGHYACRTYKVAVHEGFGSDARPGTVSMSASTRRLSQSRAGRRAPSPSQKGPGLLRYWSPKIRSVTRGEWVQFDGERRIAIIRQVAAGSPPRPLLRADTWAAVESERDFLGYFPVGELRLAAEMVWEEYQAAIAAQKSGARRAAA